MESIDADSILTGWASFGKAPVEVVAYRGKNEIARTSTTIWREGLDGNFGFRLAIDSPPEQLRYDLAFDRVAVYAENRKQKARLDFIGPLHSALVSQFIFKQIGNLTARDRAHVLGSLQNYALARDEDHLAFEVLDGAPLGETTQVSLPVGLTSFDKVAVLGRQGYVFLLGGNNKLIEQYRMTKDDPAVVAASQAWLAAMRNRIAILEGLGDYLQLFIPEKASVLIAHFPLEIGGRTAILETIEAGVLADPSLAAHYVSAFDILSVAADPPFLKIDTHISVAGARAIIAAILDRSGLPPLPDVEFEDTMHLAGDVGRRILTPHVTEAIPVPAGAGMAAWSAKLEIVVSTGPEGGHHRGMRHVTRNAAAPNDLKVVVFGTSTFNVGYAPYQLSWWMSRLFSEYHFVWSPDLDLEYVEREKPQMVICQAVERFLHKGVAI